MIWFARELWLNSLSFLQMIQLRIWKNLFSRIAGCMVKDLVVIMTSIQLRCKPEEENNIKFVEIYWQLWQFVIMSHQFIKIQLWKYHMLISMKKLVISVVQEEILITHLSILKIRLLIKLMSLSFKQVVQMK